MHYPSASVFLAVLLASSPLVSAHGRIDTAVGDAGGNGTALGIKGAVVPLTGSNSKTEVDTTVFQGKAAQGCGETEAGGTNEADSGTAQAMALSGGTLPQITAGGSLTGSLHVVTSDGFGPYMAMIDPTGQGDFSNSAKLELATQVPGNDGNGQKGEFTSSTTKRWFSRIMGRSISKRATNINENFPYKVNIPADTQCTGTVAGQSNVCMIKLVNPSGAGPFGGCVPVQMAGSAASNSTAATSTEQQATKRSKAQKFQA